MIVIVAEKPDIAKAVSKVLPGKPSWKQGYIEQGNYCVTWCYGHLLQLKDPEDYGEEYKRINTPNEKLPIFFKDWGMKVSDDSESGFKGKGLNKKAQLNAIGKLLKNADSVIIAGDIDDEGQLLVEEVLDWFKYSGPLKRLDTGALNEASLRKAMANLQNNDAWHIRAVSAKARSVSDFALGINGSRFFSNIYRSNLSIGRVQTATLGLVVNRDEQIEGHVKQMYYLLDMTADLGKEGPHVVRFYPDKDNPVLVDGKILDRSILENMSKALTGKVLPCMVKKETIFEEPPLPLSISALKTYCSDKYNIPPERTLEITQSLRMNYGGLITYNRSECRYLPENMHKDAPDLIKTIQDNLGPAWAFNGINASRKTKAWNDANTSVHHAIIPTDQKADMSKLSDEELKVYKAVCGFYMVQFMPPCKKEKTTLTVPGSNGKNEFRAVSTKVLEKGFKEVMQTKTDPESALSDVPAGNYFATMKEPVITEKETQPPKRYTDSSLEEDMKNVAKYVTDPEAKKLLLEKDKDSKEEHGSIGTAATRSQIIATLKKRGFLENKGKQVISTDVGRKFYKILPDDVRKPDLTAKWWALQQGIQDGTSTPEDMYKDVLDTYRKISSREYPDIYLGKAQTSSQNQKSLGACPRCGKPVIEGTKGFGCSGWRDGCKFTIWKEGQHGVYKVLAYNNKKITPAMVKSLLKNGKVTVRDLESEKTGKKYDANIVLKDNGQYASLEMDFNDIAPVKRKKA